MEASFLSPKGYPIRFFSVYPCLSSSRTGCFSSSSTWGLSLVLLLHNSLISSSMQYWSSCITNSSYRISSPLPSYNLVHEEWSESLICLSLFGHSTDVLSLNNPGCFGLSSNFLALFSAVHQVQYTYVFPLSLNSAFIQGM